MSRVMTTGCGAVLVCLLAGGAIAETPCLDIESLFTPRIVGRWGDGHTVLDLAVRPDSTDLWVLCEDGLVVHLSLAFGDEPVVQDVLTVDPGASHLAYDDGVLAVAESGGRIRSFQTADGAYPAELRAVDLPAPVVDLAGGSGILAACGAAGLFRLGRSDGDMAVTDSVTLAAPAVAVVGADPYVYAAATDGTLTRFLGAFANSYYRWNVAMPGTPSALSYILEDPRLVAAALGDHGLRCYDNNGTCVSRRDDAAPCADVVLLPGLLAAVDDDGTVTVFSRRLPSELGAAGTLAGEPIRMLAALGDRLLLGTAGRGLLVATVAATSSPVVPAGTVPAGGNVVAVDGALAAVAGTSLRMFDLGPDVPVEVGGTQLPVAGVGVALRGDLVCVADQTTGLLTYDVRVPSQPYPVGQAVLERYAGRVEIVDDVALVLAVDRVVAVDVSDPAAPVVGKTCFLPQVAVDMTRVGSKLYVASPETGVQIIDVAAPAAPVIAGSLTPAGPASRVAGLGDVLLTMNSASLASWSLADPVSPRLVGTVTLPWELVGARAVAVAPRAAWWAADGGQVIQLTVTPEGGLEPLAVVATGAVTNDLAFAGDRALVLASQQTTVLPVPCGTVRGIAPTLQGLDGGGGFVLFWNVPDSAPGGVCVFRDGDADPIDETPFACVTASFWVDVDPGPHTYRVMYRDAWGRWSLPSNEVVRKSTPSPVPQTTAATLSAAPNPFNPRTTLHFTLAQAGPVRLTIHDLTGRKVAVLVDGDLPAGGHAAPWNGRDAGGRAVASGVYLARLVTAEGALTARLTLLR